MGFSKTIIATRKSTNPTSSASSRREDYVNIVRCSPLQKIKFSNRPPMFERLVGQPAQALLNKRLYRIVAMWTTHPQNTTRSQPSIQLVKTPVKIRQMLND